MLLNLIDFNEERIKEIHKFYADKYEFMEDYLKRLDCNITKLQEINKKMKTVLDFLDDYWEKTSAK